MRFKRLVILLPALCITVAAFAQADITGTWEGKFLGGAPELGEPKLVVEIYNLKDSFFSGVTHLYYKDAKYEHYKMIGWYDAKDSLLVFREATVISVDVGNYLNCLGTYKMTLSKQGNYLLQAGIWDPNIMGCSYRAQAWLKKKLPEPPPAPVKIKQPAVTKTVPAKKPVAATQPVKERTVAPVVPVAPVVKTPVVNAPQVRTAPAVLPAKIAQRQTDIQSLLEIAANEKDSIRVDVYDNGEIDGDSVSVYQDEILRVNKKLITAKPITFYISLDKDVNPIAHLRLVAESLGSIPPCTALMIVTTRTKRYEVHLSSNFSKNATVELFLKE